MKEVLRAGVGKERRRPSPRRPCDVVTYTEVRDGLISTKVIVGGLDNTGD